MSRKRTSALELFLLLKSVTEAFSDLESSLKKLKRRKLVRAEIWRTVHPSLRAIAAVLDHAWMDLHKNAATQAFPELIRQDQVIHHFQISPQTLYRRRKDKEFIMAKIRKIYSIKGMRCASCVRVIERAVKKVGGVQDCIVNLATEQSTRTYDKNKSTTDHFARAVKKADMDSSVGIEAYE